jgi:hypothetical protein
MINYIQSENFKNSVLENFEDNLESVDQNNTADEWNDFDHKLKTVKWLIDLFGFDHGCFLDYILEPKDLEEPAEISFGLTIGKDKYDYSFSTFENILLSESIKINSEPVLFRTHGNTSLCPVQYFSQEDNSINEFQAYSCPDIIVNPALLKCSLPGKKIRDYLSKIIVVSEHSVEHNIGFLYGKLQEIYKIELYSIVSEYLSKLFKIDKIDEYGYTWHGNTKIDLRSEGSGVWYFAHMFPYFYISKTQGYTMCTPIFDLHLHPKLSKYLFEWYYDEENKGGQLITRFKNINKADGSIFIGRQNAN